MSKAKQNRKMRDKAARKLAEKSNKPKTSKRHWGANNYTRTGVKVTDIIPAHKRRDDVEKPDRVKHVHRLGNGNRDLAQKIVDEAATYAKMPEALQTLNTSDYTIEIFKDNAEEISHRDDKTQILYLNENYVEEGENGLDDLVAEFVTDALQTCKILEKHPDAVVIDQEQPTKIVRGRFAPSQAVKDDMLGKKSIDDLIESNKVAANNYYVVS